MEKNNTGDFAPKKFTKRNLQFLKKRLLNCNKGNPAIYFEASEMGYDIDTLVSYISQIPTELHIIAPDGTYTAYRLNHSDCGEDNEFHLDAMTDYILTSPAFEMKPNPYMNAEEIISNENHFILRTYLFLECLEFGYIVYMPKQLTKIQRQKISEVCSRYCRFEDIRDDEVLEYEHATIRAYKRKLYSGGIENLKKMGVK